MARERNNSSQEVRNTSNKERRSSVPNDLPDTPGDAEKLKSEETMINLPDVKDIPGQEFVKAPPLGELSDTTIAADDEEGRSVFGDSDQLNEGNDADVDRDEKKALADTEYYPSTDEDNLRAAGLDDTDFDKDPLNEKGSIFDPLDDEENTAESNLEELLEEEDDEEEDESK
jgi:hypothetical protein